MLNAIAETYGKNARAAARALATARGETKNRWLAAVAGLLADREADVLAANAKDVANAPTFGLTPAQVDRLRLTPARLRSAAAGIREIVALPDPVGQVRESRVRPNGLEVHKVGVPLGVILFIYESRPNVTLDAAALAVKSGNAILLRGGKEAVYSNRALHAILREALEQCGLPPDAVQLVTEPDREIVGHLLRLSEYIDLVIPRGGEGLIRRVAEEARMPVMKHYKGNCHVFVEQTADLVRAEAILLNAKCQRPGVCNAMESVLVDVPLAAEWLPRLVGVLQENGVEVRGCPTTAKAAPGVKPATEADYSEEYLDLIVSVKVVDGIDEAVAHIARYGSGHTDAILTSDLRQARRFTAAVDSSAVLVNASTRFNDGMELGLGAEIGISTDKFHARGPCGLLELTSYKYVVYGDGHVRE